jgi:nucleotide-binding universal stress UspA family protein
MYGEVIVGVDGRQGGRDAIALAGALAGPDARITLAHVYGDSYIPSAGESSSRLAQEREAAEALLADARTQLAQPVATLALEAFSPGRGLHELAAAQHADLLVLGSCHRGLVGRAMLGDDTRASLNGAPCAVAVASAGYSASSTPLANIGVAYNGSPESVAALALACDLAAGAGATVHAIEVVPLPVYGYTGVMPPLANDTIEEMLEAARTRLGKLDRVQAHVQFGFPGEELARFSDQLDLLVAGSRGYGPVRHLVRGSTCGYLERHARCSLLVLPRPAGAATGAATGNGEEHAGARVAGAT